ncbi:unnamed protein product [Lymnaea stagnalis]|uniref:Uncharacterized protein n=1 Tax=Lymnaea stagnalis TaxID=6523 RepID=A0AAV2HXV7_LYMST
MAYKGDMDTEDLDQLIHSYEYENQNFVKMIEQENQLIKALESQIEESTEDTKRMETDISHFEEETQRLLKQCNINKVNIDSQKKTRGLMCDHEAALLKKLESFKLETAEKQKFYKENIVKYSDIRDDHMRKYRCFPMAIELENKKAEVLSAQELVSQAESTKTSLKEMVAAKEDELNSKVMSRIIVKIAKAKLRTFQLDKEIQECLHQRDALLKQVEDVSHSKLSVQTNDCVHQYSEEIPMETGEESLAPKNSRSPPQ